MQRKIQVTCLLWLAVFYSAGVALAQEPMKVSIINAERKEVGEASITDGPSGVIIGLSLRDNGAAIPAGAHGFHIHDVGKCEPPFKSAGDHFAPQQHGHGFLSEKGGHAGDLPNIHVPKSGELMVEFFVPNVRLRSGKNALLDKDGSALVIHAQKDDYRSDPSGHAGDRLACGAIASRANIPGAK